MKIGYFGFAVAMSLSVLSGKGYAASLSLDSTVGLSNFLASASGNFHPQGLGYDTGSNELLFMQQQSQTIYRTDLNGNITGSRSVGLNHTTSVAGDGVNYYFSDYTGNSGFTDLYRIGKASGSAVAFSSEIAAFGGYPIDVRDGMLYRAQNTTFYDWSGLNQVRISSLAAPDSILQTVNLATAFGIGDFAVDSARNQIWVIDYSASASIRLFNLLNGDLLDTFALGLDGLTAGLTYANDKLFYYDWNNGSGSTLSRYSIGNVSPVPLPAALPLFGTGLGVLGFFGWRKRRRRVAVTA